MREALLISLIRTLTDIMRQMTDRLAHQGWSPFDLSSLVEAEVSGQLLKLASSLGAVVAARRNGAACELLSPMNSQQAKYRSLSKIHSHGEFPLHNDLAHWPVPCRYIILACIDPGGGNRFTRLLDTKRMTLSRSQLSMLHSEPFRVANGRRSFFSTILTRSRAFIRYDSGCMSALSPTGSVAEEIFSHHRWTEHIEAIHWRAGSALVIDNWRVLHGRSHSDCIDTERKMLRVCIQ